MSLTDEDLLEIFDALEERSKQKALEKQLLQLTLDTKQEKNTDFDNIKGGCSIKINRNVDQQEGKEEQEDQFSYSVKEDSLKHSNVSIKKDKIRENLRKVALEQKFKNKRIFEPVMSELKEVEEGREEDSSPFKQEQVTKIQQSGQEEEENVLNEVQEDVEQKNQKETQKKRRTKSSRK